MPTIELRKRAIRALDRTWDVIGGDVLQAVGGKDITRDEVIENVTSCGIQDGYPEMYGDDKEAVKWLDSQPREVQDEICKEAFPHSRYGY